MRTGGPQFGALPSLEGGVEFIRMRRVSRSVHFDIYSLRVSAYDPSAPIQSPLTCSCFSLLSVVLSLGPRTARAAARTGSSRLRRKKRCVRDPLDRGSARVCDLIDTILRRWGHGPSLYLLRRHPGPPSETKGARASGARGGGFNDPLDSASYRLVSCSLPQRVCQVLTSAPGLIPGHRGHAYRHSLVCGAIYIYVVPQILDSNYV